MARKLEVEIVGDAASLNRALKDSQTHTSKFGKSLNILKGAAIGAGAAIGTGIVVGLDKSIHAAIEAQTVHARLVTAFKNAGLNAEKYAKQIDMAESAGRRLGFTDEQTQNSLGSLIVVTKNVKQATKEMGIAQDLARFKGVSLEQATKALTMAHAGSLRALKQLGLDIPKVTTAQDQLKAATKDHTTEAYKNALAQAKVADKAATLKNVLQTVTDTVRGQAKAYSDTTAGAMAQFHAQLVHIEVEIGNKLLPIMTQAIIWIRDHWPEISKSITNAWNQIKPTLIAFEQTTIGLVNVIRANWGTIGPIVNAAAAAVRAALAIMTAPMRIIIDLLRGDWSGAWHVAVSTVEAAATAIKALAGSFAKAAYSLGAAIVSGILEGIRSLEGMIISYLQSLASRALHSALNALNPFGGGHGKQRPHGTGGKAGSGGGYVPRYGGPRALGGPVRSGYSYMVGERGPEMFTPNQAGAITPAGGGMVTVNLQVDAKTLASILIDPLRGEAKLFQNRTGRPAFS